MMETNIQSRESKEENMGIKKIGNYIYMEQSFWKYLKKLWKRIFRGGTYGN